MKPIPEPHITRMHGYKSVSASLRGTSVGGLIPSAGGRPDFNSIAEFIASWFNSIPPVRLLAWAAAKILA